MRGIVNKRWSFNSRYSCREEFSTLVITVHLNFKKKMSVVSGTVDKCSNYVWKVMLMERALNHMRPNQLLANIFRLFLQILLRGTH